jgi:hypothetical protein
MLSVARPANKPEETSPENGEEGPHGGVGVEETTRVGVATSAEASTSYQMQAGHDDRLDDLDSIARQAGLDDAAVSFSTSRFAFYISDGEVDAPTLWPPW